MSKTDSTFSWTVYEADKLTQREIYGLVLKDLGGRHPEIVGLSADLAKSTKIGTFGVAAGLAMAGLTPFVSTFSAFASMRACEFVRTDICYQNLNVKIIATHGGISFGSAGTTHHATEDYAIVRAFPHLTVIVPADAIETAQAVKQCMEIEGPVYIRIGRGFEPAVYTSEDYEFEVGKAIEMRPGTDLAIIATGATVYHAVQAADILKNESGISARVLNMHTLKPLDEEAVLKALTETRRLITVEDHNVINGLGSAVAVLLTTLLVASQNRRSPTLIASALVLPMVTTPSVMNSPAAPLVTGASATPNSPAPKR